MEELSTSSLSVALWLGCSAALSFWVSRMAPEMVMDEIFHVPQTQKYCQGDMWSWDPKITTFPGTYVLGATYASILSTALPRACTTVCLRSLNVLLSTGVFAAVARILALLHPTTSALWRVLWAVTICLLPTHFFFQFLYYTDISSVLFVLLSYESVLERRWASSALWSGAAVFCRQTNVVWCGFVLGAGVLHWYQAERQRKPTSLQDVLLWVSQNLLRIATRAAGHVAILLSFAAFLRVNGGIVVGDKDAHPGKWHPMQLWYFALFTSATFCLATDAPRRMFAVLAGSRVRATLILLAATAIALYCVREGTLVHPYLLADNRHYTFYIWKNVLGKSAWVRQMLAPIYALSLVQLFEGAVRSRGWMWGLGFFTCVVAVSVPAWLVEFRYFTTGAILYALNVGPPNAKALWANMLLFLVTNVVTLVHFAHRPFIWPDGTIARFMW